MPKPGSGVGFRHKTAPGFPPPGPVYRPGPQPQGTSTVLPVVLRDSSAICAAAASFSA